jgi:hypothetical protein
VVAERGLRDIGREIALEVLAAVAEHASDLESGRIGERGQHREDGDLFGLAVVKRSHVLRLPPMIDD